MAITFRAAGTVFSTGTGTAGTFTANVPAGVQSGDLLLAIGLDWAGSGVTWTTPSGWTLVRNDNDAGVGDIGVHVYRKIAGASETNQNFTLSAVESGLMVMLAYMGQDGTTPIDISNATITDITGTGGALTTPSVTTTVANDVLVLIFSEGSGSGTPTAAYTTPAGATSRVAVQRATSSGTQQSFAIFDIAQASAGASGTFSSTLSGMVGGTTYGTGAQVIAIKATASGGTPSDSDSGTLTDTANQVGLNGPSDTSSVGEAAAIGTGSSDSALLAEQNAIALLLSDAAAFAEQVSITVTAATSDSATVTDSASANAGQVSKSDSDAAALAEQIKLALTVTDSAQLGEAMAVALAHQDTATLQELVSVAIAIADAATLTEGASVSVQTSSSDAGSLIDAQSQTSSGGPNPAIDSATVADNASATAATVTSDVGALAEQAAIKLGATDVVAMTEQIGLALVAADSAALTEQVHIAVAAAAADSVHVAELQAIVASVLAAAEAVSVSDSAHVTQNGESSSALKVLLVHVRPLILAAPARSFTFTLPTP